MTGSSGAPLTMKDMAALAGVSESTVSRALADHPSIAAKTRARIQALSAQHGYTINPVARSLRSRQTRTLAVVIPLFHDQAQHLSDPFFSLILGHLADAAASRGYDMLLSKVVNRDQTWVGRAVETRRADAVIVIGQSLGHEAIAAAARQGVPVVAWGAKIEDGAYATVGSDNRMGGDLAASHLLDDGRRRLAFLGDRRLPEPAQRFEGFTQAHKRRGLAWDPALVVDARFEPGEARRDLLPLVRGASQLDGVVAASDLIAISMIQILNEAGRRTPKDVGVVGFDDTAVAAHTTPPLTTIRQDVRRGSELLVDLALKLAAGEAVQAVELPVELVVRGSSTGAR
jgi:DNA-binding LacI/PurR family transcriptional regulator